MNNATTSQAVTPFRLGEVVDITIKGARVIDTTGTHPPTVHFTVPTGQNVSWSMPLDHKQITVERATPAEWPPQAGDLWRDRHGNLWFAILHDYPETDPYIGLVAPSAGGVIDSSDPDEIAQSAHGPLELVRRESDGGQS